MDIDTGQRSSEHWYNNLNNSQPFRLDVKVSSKKADCTNCYKAVSCFPWTIDALPSLWSGRYEDDREMVTKWRNLIKKWTGVVAVGGGSNLCLFVTRPKQNFLPLFTIAIPDDKADVRCIAWCITVISNNIYPLVVFSGNRLIYVLNAENGEFHGILRGHGGQINALAVHPTAPDFLLSASHDHTCRIYDLSLEIACPINNLPWPGQSVMSLAGPAFGLRANDGEGLGYGRCVGILTGGPSGGHTAPVLDAAFNPDCPIIATCGMDHTVKLWRMPEHGIDMIKRQVKPLFSSSRIHSAQVLSITWIAKDILMSHSGPILMREEDDAGKLYKLPGRLVLWVWLGFDRFFPENFKWKYPPVLRGCGSDSRESSSFKVISEYKLPLPMEPVHMHVYQSPHYRPSLTPLLFIPSRGVIHASSLKLFKPRKPMPFPEDGDLDELSKRLVAGEGDETISHWDISIEARPRASLASEAIKTELPKIEACTVSENGRLLIGVGAKEGIWIWRIPR